MMFSRLYCWIGLHNYQKKWPGFFWKCRRCGRLQGWWERGQYEVTTHKAHPENRIEPQTAREESNGN